MERMKITTPIALTAPDQRKKEIQEHVIIIIYVHVHVCTRISYYHLATASRDAEKIHKRSPHIHSLYLYTRTHFLRSNLFFILQPIESRFFLLLPHFLPPLVSSVSSSKLHRRSGHECGNHFSPSLDSAYFLSIQSLETDLRPSTCVLPNPFDLPLVPSVSLS